jgi:hypothetical protein
MVLKQLSRESIERLKREYNLIPEVKIINENNIIIRYKEYPKINMPFTKMAYEYNFPAIVLKGFRELYFQIKKEQK